MGEEHAAGRASDPEILAIYRQTMPPLYRAVSRRCNGERALAEDIVQETWLRAIDAWRVKGVPDAPAAWLTVVARNLLVSHFRKHRTVGLDALAREPVATPSGAADDEQIARVIERGLAGLAAGEAGVLHAFHLEERPVAAIAADLRISERAVEGRLRRARLKLRGLIERATGSKGERP